MVVTKTLCSICIATYKRPDLLRKLIESLLIQNLESGVHLEIIVVDNDHEQSAKTVVDAFENPRFPIIYAVEPRKNISHARNKAVELATGNYVFFIDDDESASETWVMKMLEALHQHQADAVFGRVIPEFHPQTPEWMKGIFLYNRPTSPTGTKATFYTTGNCLVKSALLKREPGPFDERFGITGGEDSDLFNRLQRNDRNFIMSHEGWVAEYVPPERTDTGWLLKRAYRTGNLYGRRQIEKAQNTLLSRFKLLAHSVLRILGCLFLTFIHFPNLAKRWHWFLKTASNWGKLLAVFNMSIDGY